MKWLSHISWLKEPSFLKRLGLLLKITSSSVSGVGVILVGLVIKHCIPCTSSRSASIFPSLLSGFSLFRFRSPVIINICFLREAHMQASFSYLFSYISIRLECSCHSCKGRSNSCWPQLLIAIFSWEWNCVFFISFVFGCRRSWFT